MKQPVHVDPGSPPRPQRERIDPEKAPARDHLPSGGEVPPDVRIHHRRQRRRTGEQGQKNTCQPSHPITLRHRTRLLPPSSPADREDDEGRHTSVSTVLSQQSVGRRAHECKVAGRAAGHAQLRWLQLRQPQTNRVLVSPCYTSRAGYPTALTRVKLSEAMTSPARRTLLRAGGVIALAGAARPSRAATSERPNVLFILADDLGWADLGVYGATDFATPAPRPAGRAGRAVHPGLRQLRGLLGDPVRADHRPLPVPPARRAGGADRRSRGGAGTCRPSTRRCRRCCARSATTPR